jgi:hypothetical protein
VLKGDAAKLFQEMPVSGVISASKRAGGQVISKKLGRKIEFGHIVESGDTLYVFDAAWKRDSFLNEMKAMARKYGTMAKEVALTGSTSLVGAEVANQAAGGNPGEVVGPVGQAIWGN